MKIKCHKPLNPIFCISNSDSKGFTLIEILVSAAIFVVIIAVIFLLSANISTFSLSLAQSFETQQEAQQTLETMASEMRPMESSGLGAYAIAQVSTSSITFFSDIDGDGVPDQVRYFLDGTTFKKGVIKPAGNPLVYDPNSEQISEMVHNMAMGTSSIFTYYDSGYDGSEPPMAYPINISNIRTVSIRLIAQEPNQTAPEIFFTSVTPRNLRTND